MTSISNRVLRAFSLVVTDRRWAGPLSAMALGFGLFIGVAIGPTAAGTLAGTPQIIEIPASDGGTSEDRSGGGGGPAPTLAGGGEGAGSEGGALGALPAPSPAAPEEAPAPEAEPQPAPPEEEEGEPESEEALPLEGTVVHTNPAAGSYTVAIKGGELVSVHAARLPVPGTKLKLSGRRLDNGTFAEAGKPKSAGTSSRASFRGVVTFVDPTPAAPAYTVSGRGSSILVGVRPDPSGSAPALPAINSYATVEVKIERQPTEASVSAAVPVPETAAPAATVDPAAAPPPPACAPDPSQPALKAIQPAAILWQQKIEVEAEPATYVDLAGIVAAICPQTGQILLSADDTRASAQDLTLTVPARIKAAKLVLGDSFLATATVEPDGSLTLAGVASDEKVKGAEDPKTAQGDLKR